MPSSGLDGVSTQTARVLGRSASRTVARSWKFATENSTPQRVRTLAKSRKVPP